MRSAVAEAVDIEDQGPVSLRRPAVGPQSRKVARGEPRFPQQRQPSTIPPPVSELPPERVSLSPEEDGFLNPTAALKKIARFHLPPAETLGSSRPPPLIVTSSLAEPRPAVEEEEDLPKSEEPLPSPVAEEEEEALAAGQQEDRPTDPEDLAVGQEELAPERVDRPTDLQVLVAVQAELAAEQQALAIGQEEALPEQQESAPEQQEQEAGEDGEEDGEEDREEQDEVDYQADSSDLLPPVSGQVDEEEEEEQEQDEEPEDEEDEENYPDSEQVAARRSWVPPQRLSYMPGALSPYMPGAAPVATSPSPSRTSLRTSQVPHERGLGPLFMASIVALPLVALAVAGPTLVESYHRSALTMLGDNRVLKHGSGYTLVGLVLISLFLSVRKMAERKRWKWFAWSDFPIWRMIHGIIGTLTVLMLVLHTGMQLGAQMVRFLSLDFLAAALLGGVVGGVTALSGGQTPTLPKSWRRPVAFVHVLVFWPLPVLVILHIIQVYFY
jgi:hypothetical protein